MQALTVGRRRITYDRSRCTDPRTHSMPLTVDQLAEFQAFAEQLADAAAQ